MEEATRSQSASCACPALCPQAYQMHLDTMYNKLQTLEEYVQDTEVRGTLYYVHVSYKG